MAYDDKTAARVRAALERKGPRLPDKKPAPSWGARARNISQSLGRSRRTEDTTEESYTEQRMFGGIAFLRAGHMCLGVHGHALIARVGPTGYTAALTRPHTRPFDLTGAPRTGFVFVDPPGFENPQDLARWVDWCVEFVDSLPAKG